MEDLTHQTSRPLAVKLALGVLLLHVGSLEIVDAIHGDWDSILFCGGFAITALLVFAPLWFVYSGKNWARWLLVVMCVGELCLIFGYIVPRLISRHSLTGSWILSTCFHNAIDIAAVAALFLPSSNQWFRAYANAGG